jgi:hypothetical protein
MGSNKNGFCHTAANIDDFQDHSVARAINMKEMHIPN